MDLPVIEHDTPHLSRVTPSLLAALGVPGFAGSLDLPPVSRACVLLIDGLGWELLDAHAGDAPVLTELRRAPLRVGYPATTVAGLAAIGTGVASGEHGMAGYTFEVPGVGVLNALRWCRHPEGGDLSGELSAEQVQPMPTTFDRAAAAGLATSVVSSAKFAGTALTKAVLRGGRYVGVHALGDLAAATLDALRPERAFCYAYHSELDMLGHLYGPGTPAWRMQLAQVDRLVESIVDGLPAGSVLAVVADHGMVRLDETVLDLDAVPALGDGVRALAGEVRARHVHTENGATADVLATWRELLGDRAWVVEREQAIEQGWFGPRVADQVRPRIGDVVAAARGRSGLLRRTTEPLESALVGQHGSFTSAEQLVPLALAFG
ncbi:alkaline phosphatase family protein [Prauserella endophytica]|uniref:Alkaline phosphatase family protein n=1 Tax=Prauserella endophytica TaxID=1592324 RepID=A0ABY2S155_9PSEU|nr:nucleotide pyrophosphatase/phosphodiesterase family protein [Prauserella endophytica]TKG66206.1 alkaline phosphatase family protein [Prauserella endophytica]